MLKGTYVMQRASPHGYLLNKKSMKYGKGFLFLPLTCPFPKARFKRAFLLMTYEEYENFTLSPKKYPFQKKRKPFY